MYLVRLIIILLMGCFSHTSQGQSNIEIRVNLQGYPGDMPKKALILSKYALDNPIMVLKDEKGALIREYKCPPHEKAWHPFSHYYVADFSDFKKTGKYYFELKGFTKL